MKRSAHTRCVAADITSRYFEDHKNKVLKLLIGDQTAAHDSIVSTKKHYGVGGRCMSLDIRDCVRMSYRATAGHHRRLSAVCLVLTASFLAEAAHADLEEIIVTARKRDESLQNTPVAVAALSAEQLANNNIASIETIAARMPDFVVARGSSGSGANLSIRGIGSNFTSIGIEQSVSVNVDGIYQGQGRILNEGMFDMHQVEILKGPQALFFGKNATAGAVSLTTADPTRSFEATVRGGYETKAQDRIVDGFVSGPIIETLSARLAVQYSNMNGGWMKNEGYAQSFQVTDLGTAGVVIIYNAPQPDREMPQIEHKAARLTLMFEPTDRITAKLKGDVNESDANSGGYDNELWSCASGSSQLSPGAECKGDWRTYDQYLPAQLVKDNPLFNRHGGHNYEESKSRHVTGILNFKGDKLDVDWVSGWQGFYTDLLLKSDATPMMNRGTFAGTSTAYRALSSELRTQTHFDSPLNVAGGLYYQKSDLDFNQDIIFPGTATGGLRIDSTATDPSTRILTVRKVGRTDGETYAAFGQLIYRFAPQWELTAGARYTEESKDSTFKQPYVIPAFRAVFRQYDPNNPLTLLARNQKWHNVSPEAVISWRPSDDLLLYTAYKQGYKSGGFSISALNSASTTANDLAFNPEKARGVEAGVKATTLDHTLRLGATLFAYRYSDLQIDFFNSATTTFVTFNAGAAKTRGVELEAEWAPHALAGLTVRATVAYLDAFYSDFPGAPCYAGETPAMGCVPANATYNYVHQDLKGVDTALAPEWTASLGADYGFNVGAGLTLTLSGYLKYSDKYALSPFGDPGAIQDAYATLDASVRLASESQHWEFAVIGKNLTDKYVLTGAQDAPSTGAGTGTASGVAADRYGFPAPPRTVLGQVTFRF